MGPTSRSIIYVRSIASEGGSCAGIACGGKGMTRALTSLARGGILGRCRLCSGRGVTVVEDSSVAMAGPSGGAIFSPRVGCAIGGAARIVGTTHCCTRTVAVRSGSAGQARARVFYCSGANDLICLISSPSATSRRVLRVRYDGSVPSSTVLDVPGN